MMCTDLYQWTYPNKKSLNSSFSANDGNPQKLIPTKKYITSETRVQPIFYFKLIKGLKCTKKSRQIYSFGGALNFSWFDKYQRKS
jgi:hypothetical protein